MIMTPRFKELTQKQKDLLRELEIDECFVSEKDMITITKAFKLQQYGNVEELRALRNSVVKYLGDLFEIERDNYKVGRQLLNNMSGVTAVIDNRMFALGGTL